MIKKGVIEKDVTPCVCGKPAIKKTGKLHYCGDASCEKSTKDLPTKIARATGIPQE